MPGTDGLPSLSFTVTHGVDERKWKPTKLTPLGAWLRWEFNPGLSDVTLSNYLLITTLIHLG